MVSFAFLILIIAICFIWREINNQHIKMWNYIRDMNETNLDGIRKTLDYIDKTEERLRDEFEDKINN